LAGSKADLWRLRQHASVLALPFKEGIKRPDRDNAIDQFLQPDATEAEKKNWANVFTHIPEQLTNEERRAWLQGITDVVLGSDAFFPFRDNVDEAARYGVTAIIQPGGSIKDDESIAAANEHGITMAFTGIRHFKH